MLAKRIPSIDLLPVNRTTTRVSFRAQMENKPEVRSFDDKIGLGAKKKYHCQSVPDTGRSGKGGSGLPAATDTRGSHPADLAVEQGAVGIERRG